MSLTVLIGGARSGKSSLAVEWGRRTGRPVAYVATAPSQDRPDDGGEGAAADADRDDDLARRIDHHRAERPTDWTTIEEPVDLIAALDAAADAGVATVIIDCLTLWTSNLMWHDRSEATIDALATETARCAADYGRPVLAITNEVGLGVHPETELGRHYRDVLGRVNQRWAAAADRSLLLVGGKALELGDPWDLLPDPGDPATR